MDSVLLLSILASAVQSGTPILYATLGEILTERAGVLNLGVEGMMVTGALFGFLGAYFTGSAWMGVLAAGCAAMLLASLHAVVCLHFLGNQVVSGLALTILGVGLADTLGAQFIGMKTSGFSSFHLPVLADIPFVGGVFFKHDILVYISYFLPFLFWFFLNRTRMGLALCAVGENPAAASAAGLNPLFLRWFGILAGAFFVGVGGAYLSLVYTHFWTNSITAGRGWIAVALVIFAFWRPGRAMLGAYFFGGIIAFQLRLQASGTVIPSDLLAMLPFVLTIAALILSSVFSRNRSISAGPEALGTNIEPQE